MVEEENYRHLDVWTFRCLDIEIEKEMGMFTSIGTGWDDKMIISAGEIFLAAPPR